MPSPYLPSQDHEPRARVELIHRPGCHLCEDAREVLAAVATPLGVTWQERSIDDEPELRELYAELIPVILVDGKKHAEFVVDPGRLTAALQGKPRWWRRG